MKPPIAGPQVSMSCHLSRFQPPGNLERFFSEWFTDVGILCLSPPKKIDGSERSLKQNSRVWR